MTQKELRYTLVADGPSDRALLHVVTWLLQQLPGLVNWAISPQFADLRLIGPHPDGLSERIQAAIKNFPCEILFVHRDAERDDPTARRAEIQDAIPAQWRSFVCVVPVRMTEAWLLINEQAIRTAAGNPCGTAPLDLPSIDRLEAIPDPKQLLRQLLCGATMLGARRLEQFRRDLPLRVQRVAELISDFGPLRRLRAFQELEKETVAAVTALR